MRYLRLVAIGVVLLVLVGSILGMACAGAQGEQGPQGETGATGPAGPAGPQGPQGEQGVQGEKGDTGLPGTGVAWQGEWSNSTTYTKHDAVGYQGSSYVSRQNGNTNHAPTDSVWWDLWVEKGETGAAGTNGADGAPGADGTDGAPGPNMIVAMGYIQGDANVLRGYNVTTCTWNGTYYTITFTGFYYIKQTYVTLVNPDSPTARYVYCESSNGTLQLRIYNDSNQTMQASFSFMVLDTSP